MTDYKDKLRSGKIDPTPHEWDDDSMWTQIKPHIPRENKRNRLLFIILFGFITAVGLYIFPLDTANTIFDDDEVKNKTPLPSSDEQTELTSDILANSTIKTSSLSTTNEVSNSIEETAINQAPELTDSQSTNQYERASVKRNAPLIQKSTIQELTNVEQVPLKTSVRNTKKSNLYHVSNYQNDKDKLLTPLLEQSPIPSTSLIERLSKKNGEEVLSLARGILNTQHIYHISLLPKRIKGFLIPNKQLDAQDKPHRKRRIELELLGGYHNFKNVFSNINTDNIEQLSLRKNSEQYDPSFLLSFKVFIPIRSSKWSIYAGLNYHAFFERVEHSYINSIDELILSPEASYLLLANQSRFYLSGLLTQTTTTTGRLKLYNETYAATLPIGLRYKIRSGLWSWNIDAGIMLNLAFQQHGEIINLMDQPIEKNMLQPIQTSLFRPLGFNAKAGTSYQLSNRIETSFSFGYSKYRLPLSNSLGYTAHYNILSFETGMLFKL